MNYELKDVHEHILKILMAVDRTCKEHGLRYYIWAGTMIGAVRHKGFIPWDDDLDIAMPREDYDKLVEHCREWLSAPYEMVCAETDEVYPLPFAKIQDADTTLIERMHLRYVGGIYIDVFPIDGVPANKWKRKWHFARYEYYKRVLYLMVRDPYKHGHGPDSWVPLLCRKWYNLKEVQKKIGRLLHRYRYEECDDVADYDDGERGTMAKSILGEPTPYDFEGERVMGVADYDTYLSRKYGNYMTIPPHNEQRQHNFHYLDLSRPYRTLGTDDGKSLADSTAEEGSRG